jgi:hypothetical protein
MGNVVSPLTENTTFATVAMSRYMSITKEQVFIIRRETSSLASYFSNKSSSINGECHASGINEINDDETQTAYVSRENYIKALQKAKIAHQPDMEVLLLLFTILDNNGTSFVNCNDLCIGLSLFASCKTRMSTFSCMNSKTKQNDEYNHHLYGALRFAIEIYYYHSRHVANKENDSRISIKKNVIKMSNGKALSHFLDPMLKDTHDNSNRSNSSSNNNDLISFDDAVSVLQSKL